MSSYISSIPYPISKITIPKLQVKLLTMVFLLSHSYFLYLSVVVPQNSHRNCSFVHCTQVRIQDLVKGGPQLLRPKVADVAKRSRASEASILRPGSRARLRALEAFGFLMLKYAFSHILETLFLLFLTSILTPKVDKNRALDFTSINLRHSDMLHLFFNLHEKVML